MVAGDRRSWSQFVQTYQGLVFSRVNRTAEECNRNLNRADVEDVCAEVFTCLVANEFSSLKRFEGRSSLATWLSVITRRVALRCLIKKRADRANGDPTGLSLHEPPLATETTLTQLIQAEDAARLKAMLLRLSPPDRQVLRMFYVEDLGYAEIGRQLGISINSVGPKLHRAQQRLKRFLDERGKRSPSDRSG